MKTLRSYTDMEVVLNYKPLRSYTDMEVSLQTSPTQVILTAPANEASGVDPDVLHQWEAFPDAEFYRIRAYEDDGGVEGTEIINRIVNATELQELMSENTTFHFNVMVINRQSEESPPEITGVTITPSTATVEEGSSLNLEGSVQGSGNYNQNGTWSRESGDNIPFTVDGNSIDIEPIVGDSGDQAVFRFTSDNNQIFAERTITVLESSGEFANTRAGDEDALVQYAIETGVGDWIEAFGWSPVSMSLDTPIYGVEVAQIDGELRVVEINLSENGLVGQLPSIIGNWSKLKYINIKQNALTGEIPASIGNWIEIEWLLLSGRYADDPPLNNPNSGYHIGKSDNSGNTFSGVFPDVWANFTNLLVVEISGSNITDMLYDSMGNCTELRIIIISWNRQLNDSMPSSWSNLTKLNKIYVGKNALTGVMPDITGMTDLRQFWANDNGGITGPMPDFRNSVLIREIDFDKNELNGEWPHYWNNGDFTNLISLRVAWNNFTGTLHGFENLDLRVFAITNSNITGSIPESITSNDKLIILNLMLCNLTGQIPQNGWGNHNRTRYLDFSRNNLEGPIPDELPNSEDLKHLYFQQNNLSGVVSTNHGKYANTTNYPVFEYMNIGNNDFIPSDYEDLKAILGNDLLT